jgi:hypothetical protein
MSPKQDVQRSTFAFVEVEFTTLKLANAAGKDSHHAMSNSSAKLLIYEK